MYIRYWTFFLAEDEAAAARISAKNGLESYAYNLRNSLNDEKLADKFETGDKTKLEGAVNETIKWLDVSQEASKEEYEDKQKELESIAKYVLLSSFLTFFLVGSFTPFFLALLCKNYIVLQVVYLAMHLVLAVLPAASLERARKVQAWRRSTKLFFPLARSADLIYYVSLQHIIDFFRCNISINFLLSVLSYLHLYDRKKVAPDGTSY